MPHVQLLVGTKKGAWVYTSDARRENWEVSDPIMPGWTVSHMAADTRGDQPRLYAAASHWAWGPSVSRSTDGGKTWDQRNEGLRFPEDMGVSMSSVWNVRPGDASEPGVVYAGTQPAGLFRSEDWGESWAPIDTINRNKWREYWSGTGGGDSCLHSIEIDPRDPRRVYVSISAGGTWVTPDAGETWELASHQILPTNPAAKEQFAQFEREHPELAAQFANQLPENVDPAAADEMHKLRIDPKNPDRLWAQTHVGVFRTDNCGGLWEDVTGELPSFHGFPIAVTQNNPDAVFVVPLAFEADNFRVCDGQFTVCRTTDAGKSWERLTNGLPGPHDYQSAYREGLDTDGLEQEGVYVGTSNGELYASADCGESWSRMPGTLPPILSVTAAVID